MACKPLSAISTTIEAMYRTCQDCGERIPQNQNRHRCKRCKLLVCSWCIGHTHNAYFNDRHSK